MLKTKAILRPGAHQPLPLATRAALALGPLLIGGLIGLLLLLGLALLLARMGAAGELAAVLLGPHSAWYLTRASAFAAYLLLWWSMALGLAITNRLARAWPGGPSLGSLHEHASLLGLGFTVLHALVLLRDKYIGYTLAQIVTPFAGGRYQPFWVGAGQVGFYLLALVVLSSYGRRWIGPRAWRPIHLLSFLAFMLALAHGVLSGSDTATGWASGIYLASGLSLLVLTIYRLGATPPRTASATARSEVEYQHDVAAVAQAADPSGRRE